MKDFLSLGLPEQLINALESLNFSKPTPVQEKVIPVALLGNDILATAQTGTGKTGAFGIPLIAKLLSNPHNMALVLTPTRELAFQVSNMLKSLLSKQSSIKTALLIGGDSMQGQLRQLKARPRLIVGTPGRVNDHLARGTFKPNNIDFVVLDETDRMLDMGFAPQIEKIVQFLPKSRQTLLLSATLPKNIISLAERYLNNPVRVAIASTNEVASNLKQEILFLSEDEKHSKLNEQLEKRNGSIIIFVKTKMGAEKMAKKLRGDDHSADAIHGDLSHGRRQRVIREFRDSKYRIMVATDIAARGLDISHVQHVINYDLPQCPEDYIHRVGRTARAGAEGEALCFVTPSDKRKWNAINELLNPGTKSTFEGKFKSSKAPRKKTRGGFGNSRNSVSHNSSSVSHLFKSEDAFGDSSSYKKRTMRPSRNAEAGEFGGSKFGQRKSTRSPSGFNSSNKKFGNDRNVNNDRNKGRGGNFSKKSII